MTRKDCMLISCFFPFLYFAPQGKQHEGYEAAGDVYKAVVDGACARRDEELMKFVGEGVDRDEQQRKEKPSPTQRLMRRGVEGSPGQQAEDGVLRQMRKLAYDEMSEDQTLFADTWKEPDE